MFLSFALSNEIDLNKKVSFFSGYKNEFIAKTTFEIRSIDAEMIIILKERNK